MKGHFLTDDEIERFRAYLREGEKSENTLAKYIRDAAAFSAACRGEITKDAVIAYKQSLIDSGYAVRSINSMLASLNSLFSFLGWQDCRVKALKVQRQVFCPEEKELSKAEYERLCKAAQGKRNERLNLILQTICGTGIRVSELQFITAEAVKSGEAIVSLKGKTRTVFLVKPLQPGGQKTPKTGDTGLMAFWIALAVCSGATLLLMLLLWRRQDDDEEDEEKS